MSVDIEVSADIVALVDIEVLADIEALVDIESLVDKSWSSILLLSQPLKIEFLWSSFSSFTKFVVRFEFLETLFLLIIPLL